MESNTSSEANPTPQPATKAKESKLSFSMKILLKLLIIFSLSLLLLIPKVMISNLIDEREQTSQEAKEDIAKKWGKSQCVAGPFICIPAKYNKDKTAKLTDDLIIFPETFEISGEINTQSLHRGIYDVAVYSAPFDVKGSFRLPEELNRDNLAKNYELEQAQFMFFIRQLRGLNDYVVFTTPQQKQRMLSTKDNRYLACEADMQQLLNGDTIAYSLLLDLKGSEGLYLLPVGSTSNARISSNSTAPSFTGFLPDNREINEKGFTADWNVIALNRTFAQTLPLETFEDDILADAGYRYSNDNDLKTMDDFMGISLKTGVNQYQQNTRANKYAYLIIILTFITVLFVEIRKENPIHLVQYLLVGIALVLFYTLLLSFSEFLAFGWAYLIAAAMTIGLITAYMAAILKIRKTAFTIGALMSALYIYIYILLSMETFSLLAGSIGLFIILALIMVASQKINWYK